MVLITVPMILVMRLLSVLSSRRRQLVMGAWLGRVIQRLSSYGERIVEANVRFCFPELSDEERARLGRQNFEELGISLFQLVDSIFGVHQVPRLSGLSEEEFRALWDSDQGVLTILYHQCHMYMVATVTPAKADGPVKGHYVHYRLESPMLEWIIDRLRRIDRALEGISGKNIHKVVRSLRAGHMVFYAYDVHLSIAKGDFMELFGQQIWTTTVPADLLRLSGADLLILSPRRTGEDYEIHMQHIKHSDIPQDKLATMALLNTELERTVRGAPEQYWWVHRRYKIRPPGEAKLY